MTRLTGIGAQIPQLATTPIAIRLIEAAGRIGKT